MAHDRSSPASVEDPTDLPRSVNLLLTLVFLFNPFQLLRMLRSPAGVRLRASVPYSVFLAAATLVFSVLPFALFVTQVKLLPFSPEAAQRLEWAAIGWLPLAGAGLVGVFFGILELVGFASGYRSFEGRIGDLTPAEIEAPLSAMRIRVPTFGCEVLSHWERGLLAHRPEAQRPQLVCAAAGATPILIWARWVPRDGIRGDLEVRVRCHSLVFWDSGERLLCAEVGDDLLAVGRAAAQHRRGGFFSPNSGS